MKMTTRTHPCLCVSCPECDAVFFTSVLNSEWNRMTDAEDDKELMQTVAEYAKEGFNISTKDASEFKIDYCQHLKSLRDDNQNDFTAEN